MKSEQVAVAPQVDGIVQSSVESLQRLVRRARPTKHRKHLCLRPQIALVAHGVHATSRQSPLQWAG